MPYAYTENQQPSGTPEQSEGVEQGKEEEEEEEKEEEAREGEGDGVGEGEESERQPQTSVIVDHLPQPTANVFNLLVSGVA